MKRTLQRNVGSKHHDPLILRQAIDGRKKLGRTEALGRMHIVVYIIYLIRHSSRTKRRAGYVEI